MALYSGRDGFSNEPNNAEGGRECPREGGFKHLTDVCALLQSGKGMLFREQIIFLEVIGFRIGLDMI